MALKSMKQAYLKFGAATVAAVVLVIGFVALMERDQRENARRVAAVKVANAQFLKVHEPYFTMRAVDREKLLEKATTICIGDSAGHVLQVLGKPTFDTTMASKTIPPGPPTRELAYYITIYEHGLVNEFHDEYVAIYLGADDRVDRIYRKLQPAHAADR